MIYNDAIHSERPPYIQDPDYYFSFDLWKISRAIPAFEIEEISDSEVQNYQSKDEQVLSRQKNILKSLKNLDVSKTFRPNLSLDISWRHEQDPDRRQEEAKWELPNNERLYWVDQS